MGQSTLKNMVNPEVMGKMISGELPKKIKFCNVAKVDKSLVGQAGDTITLPKFSYIGDAEDVAEGVAMGTTVLTATTTKGKIKKAGKAIELTDEAVLSGYGDPIGEANKQLSIAIASKIDNDCLDVLYNATLVYENSSNIISYEEVVKAVDLFEEESDFGTKKVIFVHPKQITQLRLDPDFRDINKYPLETMMTGVIGEVAGCLVIPSRKVKYEEGCYVNPVVITSTNNKVAPAITIYLKRDVNLEVDRDILSKTTVISADEHYTVVLSNESKVVLLKVKG